MRLNLGCGKHPIEGWTNVDRAQPADLIADFDVAACLDALETDSVDELCAYHLIEHLAWPLPFMAECWRVAKPGARFVLRCPYGSSDDADEDPTHVRRMFLQSWGYFSQPYHWRANYGYAADWRPARIWLVCPPIIGGTLPILDEVMRYRNVVSEMAVEMFAEKPARAPLKELQVQPEIIITDH